MIIEPSAGNGAFIDGIKTLKTIAENICFQFDLILNHEHFLKIAEGLYKSKYIDFK